MTPAPFPGSFPREIHNVLTFEEADGKTRMSLRSEPVNASEEEARFFESMFDSMTQGFGATFEQLKQFLAK